MILEKNLILREVAIRFSCASKGNLVHYWSDRDGPAFAISDGEWLIYIDGDKVDKHWQKV